MVVEDVDGTKINLNIDRRGQVFVPREDILDIYGAMSFTIKGNYYNIEIHTTCYTNFFIKLNQKTIRTLNYVKAIKGYNCDEELLQFIEKNYIDLLFNNGILKRCQINNLLMDKGVR
jgi:hypothetical protein